ncbi:Wzz/FepE/Etk N-terminal domain-containing protein [Chitinophaga niabensis]|uniref:Chain length determinant protein n=1 Tax=Chitinophaga niabensis TaxID=536979 RepID=A0A1N6JY40_9BACT|nr:Wzz/FepE/Etk N-terminal domain-containing protein [Chitinophaga niabensis]SIO49173.1 Chain length determinant protein [Chitinophaga niabensis]
MNNNTNISLKDLIQKLTEWIVYLIKQWKVIVLFGILGAAMGFTYAYFKQPKYVADLTFVLEEGKTSPLGAYAGLASQFGVDLGGGGNSGVFAGENIIEFLKSRLMVEKTLLAPFTKGQSMADYYMQSEVWLKRKDKYPLLKNITFPLAQQREAFSIAQDSVLFMLYREIITNNLNVNKPDKKLSFIAVSYIGPDELFAKAFTDKLVKEATDFYVETKTKRSKINVDKLQLKADSLELLLNRKTYAAAASQDLNLNPARKVATVGLELETRDKVVLQTMYGEVVKNLEISKMSMAQETPIIQIIDKPILPLPVKKMGFLKGAFIGGFLAGFFILIWLIVRKFYREIMA